MVVSVGSGPKRSIGPSAGRRNCERSLSFQSFSGRFGPLDRETLRPDLGLIDCKARGLVAGSRLSLPVCRGVLEVSAILMTGRWGEKGGERFEEDYL